MKIWQLQGCTHDWECVNYQVTYNKKYEKSHHTCLLTVVIDLLLLSLILLIFSSYTSYCLSTGSTHLAHLFSFFYIVFSSSLFPLFLYIYIFWIMRACNKNLTGFLSSHSLSCSIVNCPTSCHYPLSWRQTCTRMLCHNIGSTHCFASRHRLIFNFFLLSCRLPSTQRNSIINMAKVRKKAKERTKRKWRWCCCCYYYVEVKERLCMSLSNLIQLLWYKQDKLSIVLTRKNNYYGLLCMFHIRKKKKIYLNKKLSCFTCHEIWTIIEQENEIVYNTMNQAR